MGMRWTEFRPAQGVLEAQGRGDVFSATTVNGIVLMLNYRRFTGEVMSEETSESSIPEAIVCDVHTDKMWFGFLPGNDELGLEKQKNRDE